MYCFKYAILRRDMSWANRHRQWSLLNMWFVAMFEERLLIEAMFVFLCRVQVPPAPVFTRQPFVHSSWQRPEARSGRSSRQPRRGRGLSRNKYSFSARITSHLRPRAGCWMLAPRTLASCEDLAVCPQKVSTKCLCNFHNMRVPSRC